MHVSNIYKEGELDQNQTYKKFLLVRKEGNRNVQRNIDHYNLDMIIALGYRVQSQVATRFRRWATERLHEYIQKGFAVDDDRLKQRGNRYFRELLQRIYDIRASERNFYQQVTDIYAISVDYDPRTNLTRTFFATIIVATLRYIDEGFDYSRLDTLFLTMPISWKGNIEQYAGRLHREYKGKNEVQIYDYVDIRAPLSDSMHRKRLKDYMAAGLW